MRISAWSSGVCSSDLATKWMLALIEFEETGETETKAGKWRADLHGYDPYVHDVGRIMCYSKKGDGGANMHRAILTPRYIRRCFERAGLVEIETVAEPRGDMKNRMVKLGLSGRKVRDSGRPEQTRGGKDGVR